jgi:hypothetical protein
MKLEWGNNNASLLISATGNGNEKGYDKLYLDIIHRQVCAEHVLKDMMLNRISETQKHMHRKCEELARIKERTFMGWIRRHIF